MKHLIAIITLFALASHAQVVNINTGREQAQYPQTIIINGLPASGASESDYNAQGWYRIGTRQQPEQGNRATATEWQVVDGLANLVILEQEPIPVEVPERITPRQFRLAIFRLHGVTDAQIEAAIIENIPEPQRTEALIEYRTSTYFRRSHPMLAGVAAMFGLTSEDLDQIFITGGGIE